eukprot:CAMPEP_0204269840 /NCGR_PEP_ID=MMETSP0468-20130131/17364_1 /ASSEMBLY_ACC=CAM_ASM_000383 /TAXON_ID=2969 /ORGANISM="Oxyrrhis marina" /LENGTH=664 /DNA_ID=CAMNT_0051245289 /DNA_START=29 /DNA_END=2023 /DNA_ORIENTATION=-
MRVSVCALFAATTVATKTNPISKILGLLAGLRKTVVSDGEAEQASYEQYTRHCKDASKQKAFEIEDGQSQVADLSATIEKAAAKINSLDSKIESLSTNVKQNEGDLSDATAVRSKEHDDYVANDKELVEVIDTLERAVGVLEKALKGGSSLVQVVNNPQMRNIVDALAAVASAASVSSKDGHQLTALLQSSEDAEFAAGQAPAVAAYETHDGSSSILDLLGDMVDKAEGQKSDADKAEMTAQFEFNKVKQSLTDQIAFDNKQLDAARKGLASQRQVKATAEGDLATTQRELAEDIKSDKESHDDCEKAAEEWNASMQERKNEVAALDKATQIIKEKTGGAEAQAYGLVQTGAKAQTHDYAAVLAQIVEAGRTGADKGVSALAVRVKAVLASSSDPFAKVKGLIAEMIERLEKQAADAAAQHEFCSTETAKSTAKKEDKESEIESLSAKIAKAQSRISQLKEQVANLQGELSHIAATDKELTDIRSTEHAAFTKAEKDYSDGVDGVQMALKVLRDYYAENEANSSAGGSIISILEVAESDFSKLLTEAREAEDEAQEAYDAQMDEDKLEKTTKSGGVKYKTQEVGQLEKAIAENTDSRDGVSEELDAVLEYLSKLNDQCVAKPEPYAERKRRREAELAGLKNALEILEGESIGFLSVKSVIRHMQ